MFISLVFPIFLLISFFSRYNVYTIKDAYINFKEIEEYRPKKNRLPSQNHKGQTNKEKIGEFIEKDKRSPCIVHFTVKRNFLLSKCIRFSIFIKERYHKGVKKQNNILAYDLPRRMLCIFSSLELLLQYISMEVLRLHYFLFLFS